LKQALKTELEQLRAGSSPTFQVAAAQALAQQKLNAD